MEKHECINQKIAGSDLSIVIYQTGEIFIPIKREFSWGKVSGGIKIKCSYCLWCGEELTRGG